VLAEEVRELLAVQPGDVVVDATFGAGGHAALLADDLHGDGKLIGIVTRADLVRAFVRSDVEIAREIRDDVLRRTLWMADEAIEVVVERGEVRLSGEVETKSDAGLIPRFVQRVPGVVSVLSKLRWPVENGDRSERLALWHRQP
jgi:CBS domain-containing protein